jgi:cellulose synthase operon protein C
LPIERLWWRMVRVGEARDRARRAASLLGLACALSVLSVLSVTAARAQPAPASPPAGVSRELARARESLARGEYAAAEAALRPLARTSPAAETSLARVLYETGRYAEAIERAGSAARHAPERVVAGTLLGEAQQAIGRLDDAERSYRALLDAERAFRARMRLGVLLLERGKKREAEPILFGLLEAQDRRQTVKAHELASAALAARALGQWKRANESFRAAAALDRQRVETQLDWAQMFIDKHDQKHAAESVLEALHHNRNHPRAHALMARLQLFQSMDFVEAERALARALSVNPNLVVAHVIRAGMALRNLELSAADAALDRALAVDPTDLEALSMRAAVRFLASDEAGFAAAKRAVLAHNPRFSRMYSIIAEFAEWEHRYPELVEMAREALAIDPGDATARATLGLNLLRVGEEQAGLAELRAAWDADHFNVQVFNTLNLFEKAIARDYVWYSARPFEVRIHRQERPVLEPYLTPLLTRAYAALRERYAVTPEGPLHIELFADQVQFSVRTTGLPSVGVQGVCFGKVVTALSPKAAPFNWGQIVWHELSHVFHLQLSRGRVPRWFTEGLAEYETTLAHSDWKREDDRLLYDALVEGRLPALESMNRAFTQARTSGDLMTAYYTAYVAVKYIAERFGMERVRAMLGAWGAGKSAVAVSQEVLGLSLSDLDRDFRAHLAQRLARFRADFQIDFDAYRDLQAAQRRAASAKTDPEAVAGLAMAAVIAEDWSTARSAVATSLTLAPDNRLAHFAGARVALEDHDAAAAQRHLRSVLASGVDGYVLRMLLAHAALADRAPDVARRELEAAVALDPERPDAFRLLVEVAGLSNDEPLALRAIAALASLDQHDRTIHVAYVSMLAKRGDVREVVRAGETALFVDPANPVLHDQLGRAYVATGRAERGLLELDRALALGHPEVGPIQLARARALAALRKAGPARAAVRAAVEADPALAAEAQKVLRSL